ncbi:MAG: 1-acyl-sn-glycerol-3-phosphate acyltransferase [bacterium]|jgi:1-acyl-sn-glycerol-3-phosphate acyltransferase
MRHVDESMLSIQQWWEDMKYMDPKEIRQELLLYKNRINSSLELYKEQHPFFKVINKKMEWMQKFTFSFDKVKEHFQQMLLNLPDRGQVIESAVHWVEQFSAEDVTKAIQAKIDAFAPIKKHDEIRVNFLKEISDLYQKLELKFAEISDTSQDTQQESKKTRLIEHDFPNLSKKLKNMETRLREHQFSREYTQGLIEKLLASPFSFNRCVYPKLSDYDPRHLFLESLREIFVKDIILVNQSNEKVSFKYSESEDINQSDVFQRLNFITKEKEKGRRVFFIGHHESYLGPYFLRSILRKIGFDGLAKNCNTVVGPKMFSNFFLRSGAANVGNLFLVVPSQKTTKIGADGLALDLQRIAKRSMYLIKMPNSGLRVIKELNYEEFIDFITHLDEQTLEDMVLRLELAEDEAKEVKTYYNSRGFAKNMQDLSKADYDIFKNSMNECFAIYPEGSRSYVGEDGSVIMKYINPKFLPAYLRPNDLIVPISLVGGTDIFNSNWLHFGKIGLSIGEPREVTLPMIRRYKATVKSIMQEVADLPNIKKVIYSEEVQNATKEKKDNFSAKKLQIDS